jgi:16S rRNA (cytosine967-C5)-methyltransferase
MRGPADRALARAIVGESLRWMVDLDALIDSVTANPLAPDAKARAVLRMMLAQWLRLETPPHAVVATGLELLDGGPRRLAHGVFSTLNKQAVTLPPFPTLPAPVIARWGDLAAQVAPGLATPPPLDLTLKDPAATAEWAERLEGTSLAPGHVRLARGTKVEDLAGYADGAWWVQDLAAAIPARLLGAGNGRRVLDLCCAPGGKTLQLAAQGWHVTALDTSAKRLERVQQNLTRTGLAAELVQGDARDWANTGAGEAPFDAVLLDAPCTATGTCRRHPDVLHRIGPAQIAQMAELQALLLGHAQTLVAPGGRLVYATCSLEPQEGEEQAARVSLTPAPIMPEELPQGLLPTQQGWLRTHPGMLADQGGIDGFFIARWQRG